MFSWEINFFWFISRSFFSVRRMIDIISMPLTICLRSKFLEASAKMNERDPSKCRVKLCDDSLTNETRLVDGLRFILLGSRSQTSTSLLYKLINQKIIREPQKVFEFSFWLTSFSIRDANSIEVPIWSEIDGHDRWNWIEISLFVCVIHSSI